MFRSPLCPDCMLEALLDCAEGCALLALDPRGRIALWSGGAERMFGHNAEIIGRHIECLTVDADLPPGWAREALAEAVHIGRAELDGTWARSSGERFSARAVITAVQDSFDELAGFAIVVSQPQRPSEARTRGRDG